MASLLQLTRTANKLHGEFRGALRTSLDTAIRCGGVLTQIRDRVPDFKAWCESDFAASRRVAYNWIQLHERQQDIPKGCLTVNAALDATRQKRGNYTPRLKPLAEIQDDVIDAATVLGDVFSLPADDAYSRYVACDALAKALARAAKGFKQHADQAAPDA